MTKVTMNFQNFVEIKIINFLKFSKFFKILKGKTSRLNIATVRFFISFNRLRNRYQKLQKLADFCRKKDVLREKQVAEVFYDLTTSSEIISCLFLQEAESKSTLRRICLTDSKQSSGRRSVNPPTLVCEKLLGISVEKEPKCCNVCRTLQSYEGSNLEIKWKNDWFFGFL